MQNHSHRALVSNTAELHTDTSYRNPSHGTLVSNTTGLQTDTTYRNPSRGTLVSNTIVVFLVILSQDVSCFFAKSSSTFIQSRNHVLLVNFFQDAWWAFANLFTNTYSITHSWFCMWFSFGSDFLLFWHLHLYLTMSDFLAARYVADVCFCDFLAPRAAAKDVWFSGI